MNAGIYPDGLRLTEEEAYSLLSLCLTSPNGLDTVSERALRKLADYCSTRSNCNSYHQTSGYLATRELDKAGA